MQNILSQKSSHPPSMTVALNSLAEGKKKAGESIYNFAAGDPIIPNHPAIATAVNAAMQRGHVPYAPIKGVLELRQAASTWINQTHHTHYAVEQTIVTNGGKFALFGALQALVDPGDQVLISAPYWVSYPEMIRLSGGTSVVIETFAHEGWKLTPERLKEQCTHKTKVLLFNNACNPTGALYTRKELQKILETVAELGLFLLSDEVYSELIYTGEFVSCGAFPDFSSSTVVVQSCSKNFAMSGWRVGFAFGPEKIIDAIALFQGHMTTGTSTISQWAALGAFKHAKEISTHIRNTMCERRAFCCRILEESFSTKINPPDSGIYLFLSLEQLKAKAQNASDYCLHLLQQCNVVVVPGEAFGQERYIRFAFSSDLQEIEAGINKWSKGIL